MRALTERQRQVLDFLHRHLQTHGLPPTLHELMHAFGWASPAGAAKHLQALPAHSPQGPGGSGCRWWDGWQPDSRSSPETASSVT